MHIEKIYYVTSISDQLLIEVEEFTDGPLSILWYNNGLYGLILIGRVENDLNILKDLKKIQGNSDIKSIVYVWDDTIRVKKPT